MTLKEKQLMYTRFQSKMESACYKCVDEIVKQQNIEVPDTFINAEVWEHLNKIVPELALQYSKK